MTAGHLPETTTTAVPRTDPGRVDNVDSAESTDLAEGAEDASPYATALAFGVSRRSSQDLNVKPADLARALSGRHVELRPEFQTFVDNADS